MHIVYMIKMSICKAREIAKFQNMSMHILYMNYGDAQMKTEIKTNLILIV